MIKYNGETIGKLTSLDPQTLETRGKFLKNDIEISLDIDEYDGSVSAISESEYKVFTVRIDTTNSNSLTCVTYEDDAVGMTKGSNNWDNEVIFKDIKPCMFANGEVVYYLNPTDFTVKADGNGADMSGDDGDIMIEFPKFGYWIRKVGTDLLVSITDNPDAEGYCYDAFTRVNKGDLAHFYQGAYKGYYNGLTLRSISGETPITDIDMPTARSYAMANGDNYYLSLYCHIVAIQCLYLIKYGNLNSQEALGKGYTESEDQEATTTGATNISGMCVGDSTDGTIQIKLFGIEDFWGNIYEWIDGIITNGDCNYKIFTLPDSDGNPATNITTFNDITTKNYGDYISDVAGTNQAGFAPITYNESSSTFWADYGWAYSSCVTRFGGCYFDGDYAGAFYLGIDVEPSDALGELGARLCYH